MPIKESDYIVSSIRYDGTGAMEDNIALRRISGLDDAENNQINDSYIVLADSLNQKNYKTNLGNIITNIKNDSTTYTNVKINNLKYYLESIIHDLQTKVDEIPSLIEIQNLINSSLPENIDKIEVILKELIKEGSEIQENDILQSRIDDLVERVEYIEQHGVVPGPTGPEPPVENITYKFWLISGNELETYFNGEIFTDSFNDKYVASKVDGCPFENVGYSALYLIKQKFGYDSSVNKIYSNLYLVIPTKYGEINEANNTVKINEKTLSSGVFKIYGNEYYKQNITIEDVTYHIIKVSNETSIGSGIELNLI